MNAQSALEVEKYDEWESMVESQDKDKFNELIAPYLDILQKAAGRDISYYVNIGELDPGELNALGLVDEALIYAWRYKSRRPVNLSLKAWLLSILHRTLERLIAKHKKATGGVPTVSLEEEVPHAPDEPEDEFWDWHQPDDFTRWEDIVPGDMPTPEEALAEKEEQDELPMNYHVRQLYHRDSLPAQEVAYVMRTSVQHTVDLIV